MISEVFQVLVATPPETLTHDTRQREIEQLSEYLSVSYSRDDGTDYIVSDVNYVDAAGNAGRVYIARDPSTNAIEGVYSKVNGSWTRWLIQTKDIDPTALDNMLRISDDSKIQLVYDTDSFALGDADADGKQALVLKELSITPALLTDPVAGKGMIRNSTNDDGYKNRLDVNPDDSSLELYDSTPDTADTADKVWKLRVKEGGITEDMLNTVLQPTMMTTLGSLTLDVDSGTTAQEITWNSPLVNSSDFVVDGTEITPPRAGWYRFDIALQLRASSNVVFTTGSAADRTVELTLTGAETGNWTTLGVMSNAATIDTYTMIPITMTGIVKLTTTSALGFTVRLPDSIKTGNAGTITLATGVGTNVLSLTYIGAAS